MTQGAQTEALLQPRGVEWSGREILVGGRLCIPMADASFFFKFGKTFYFYFCVCVCIWYGSFFFWMHVDVWQKPAQYCKAIILQLKISQLKNKTLYKHKKFKKIKLSILPY